MWRFLCGAGMAMLLATPLWADECKLTDYGTLPVEMVGNQATTVAKINGQSARFVIDTGAFYNLMSAAESIQAYQQALAKTPRAAWARYGLGLAEIRSGQAEAGNADLAAARAIDAQIDARFGQYGLSATAP